MPGVSGYNSRVCNVEVQVGAKFDEVTLFWHGMFFFKSELIRGRLRMAIYFTLKCTSRTEHNRHD